MFHYKLPLDVWERAKNYQWIKRQNNPVQIKYRCAVQTQDDRAIIPINIPLTAKNVKI